MTAYRLLAAASVIACTSAMPALAQDATPQPADAPAPVSDDIVVTARRVSERLQDVPVAITAVQGGKLDSLGLRTVVDLRQAVPGLQVTYSAGRAATPVYMIRGQRADDTLLTQDQPITVYMDEAVLSPMQGSNLGMFDLENVQVLKGPQGTLFGRNTTGGAVLFTTAKPTNEFEGSVRLGYGNFDTKTATAVLNVPVNEQIRLRAALDYTKSDGYGRIVAGANAGQRLFDRDELNLRFTAAIDPTDWLRTMTTVYHSRSDNGGVAFTLLDTPSPAGAAGFVFGQAMSDAYARAKTRSVYDSEDGRGTQFARTRVTGVIHTDTIELDDNLTFKNIFSYRRAKDETSNDFDGTLVPVLDSAGATYTKTYSEEAQLQGRAFDDRLNYIFGAYYYVLKGLDGAGIPRFGAGNITFGQPSTVYGSVNNTSFSAFAQASYKLTDSLNLTAGLRYTTDKREATLTNGNFPLTVCSFRDNAGVPLPANACFVDVEKSFSKPSYLVSIDHKFGEDTLVYLTHRYSYRAGGFNLRAATVDAAQQSFKPETVKDLELGIKQSSNLGGGLRLTANLAGYYQWYNDVQKGVSVLQSDGNVGTVTQNAAKANIYGGEAELGLRYERLVELNFNYAYVKAEYKNYATLTTVGGVSAQPDDFSDRQFKYQPKHQINANLILTPDVGDIGQLSITANVYYQSKVFFSEDFQNRAQLIRRLAPGAVPFLPTDTVFGQKGYALVNGRIELGNISGSGFTAAVFGRNLFNKRYVDSAIPFQDSVGIDTGVYGAPRTYGAEVTFKF
ncbi:TonB-dependent receptor [uncultured Novosphingobium sp.]|uniref:TonB-dependent receptor n=1 Tax=uncultured Novosphingobium sp. TaxID=292277 RepID=UPI003749B649